MENVMKIQKLAESILLLQVFTRLIHQKFTRLFWETFPESFTWISNQLSQFVLNQADNLYHKDTFIQTAQNVKVYLVPVTDEIPTRFAFNLLNHRFLPEIGWRLLCRLISHPRIILRREWSVGRKTKACCSSVTEFAAMTQLKIIQL